MKRPREAADGELSITMQDGLRRVAPYWFKCAHRGVGVGSDLVSLAFLSTSSNA
jgi:hypothetical protein